MSRRITSVMLLLACACTLGGTNAVLPNANFVGEPPRDGGAQDLDGAASPSGDGKVDDTPRYDAGPPPGDGAVDSPADAGPSERDASAECRPNDAPCTVPEGCTARTFGVHFYLFCSEPRWWDEARAVCQRAGFDLVLIESQEENDFVQDNIADASWIGLNDLEREETFVWPVPLAPGVTGSAPSFSSWALFNPDDCLALGDQDCVHIRTDGKWDDMACSPSQACPVVTGPRHFVCESR